MTRSGYRIGFCFSLSNDVREDFVSSHVLFRLSLVDLCKARMFPRELESCIL
jgi:hypothetical protein